MSGVGRAHFPEESFVFGGAGEFGIKATDPPHDYSVHLILC